MIFLHFSTLHRPERTQAMKTLITLLALAATVFAGCTSTPTQPAEKTAAQKAYTVAPTATANSATVHRIDGSVTGNGGSVTADFAYTREHVVEDLKCREVRNQGTIRMEIVYRSFAFDFKDASNCMQSLWKKNNERSIETRGASQGKVAASEIVNGFTCQIIKINGTSFYKYSWEVPLLPTEAKLFACYTRLKESAGPTM
jgi:hypothetical protein